MGYRSLDSREYKVMLDPTRFGVPTSLPSTAEELWAALGEELPSSGVLSSTKPTWKMSAPRAVTFWDTQDGALYYRSDFVLRHRSDPERSRVTLKKRTPDRVLASYNGIDKSAGEDAGFDLRRKFEEDIKLSGDGLMQSLFSHSIDWEDTPKDVDLSDGILERVFPGIGRVLRGVDGDLCPLGGLTLTEHVVEKAKVELGGQPAEVALISWYQAGALCPSVVEFSYRYGDKERDFDPTAAESALLILQALVRLVAWRPLEVRTISKTSWLYREAGCTPTAR